MTPKDEVRDPKDSERPEVEKDAVKDLEPAEQESDVRGGAGGSAGGRAVC